MNAATDPLTTELAALRVAYAEQGERLQALEARLREIDSLPRRTLAADRATVLSALAAADGRHSDPLSLTRSYAQVYSQNGEDGMIAEIFRRVGTRDRYFVEVGIENGRQCNTRLLLESGWRGVWIEGHANLAQQATQIFRPFIDRGSLSVLSGMIGPDNLEAALDKAQVPASFDFLSLDIDQHTHTVWRALRRRARVACIEYNASIPPALALEVPYDPSTSWTGSNWFGAGLKTLELIGAAKGLALVGCDMTGANALFVALDEARDRFRTPFSAETHYQPPCYALLAHAGHAPSAEARTWTVAIEAAALDASAAHD